MKEEKEWNIRGFDTKTACVIDKTILNDEFTYWFHYRSIPWYRIRRIKGIDPIKTIKIILDSLEIKATIRREHQYGKLFSIWVIEPVD